MADFSLNLPLLLLFCSSFKVYETNAALTDQVIHRPLDNLQCNTTSPRSWGGCPPWAFCTDTGQCSCKKDGRISIQCGLSKTLVLKCYCLTYDETFKVYKVGSCFYTCLLTSQYIFYHELTSNKTQLTNEMCRKWGRTGTSCGDCLPGYSIPAYSYQMTCLKCSHGHSNRWKLALIVLISITVFYVALIIWRVNITAPDMYGFIFYAQLSSCPIFLRVVTMDYFQISNRAFHTILKIVSPFYTIWNLDLVKPFTQKFCLDLDPLLTLSLEYVVALYPLLLVLITGLMAKMWENQMTKKCIRKCVVKIYPTCDRTGSSHTQNNRPLMDAYVAFFVLSLTKLCYVSFDLLVPSRVDVLHPNGSLRSHYTLYFAGTVKYWGHAHRPYAILAVLMMTVFVICPTALLFLYPFHWFHRIVLSRLPQVMQLALQHFVDKFQGFYKDGTNGTRDYRYFSVLHTNLLLILFVVYSILKDDNFFTLGGTILMLASFIYVFCQPYKKPYKKFSKTSSLLLLTSGMQYSLIAIADLTSNKTFSSALMHICFLLALVPLAWMTCSMARAVCTKVRQWRKMRQGNNCNVERPHKANGQVLYGAVGE